MLTRRTSTSDISVRSDVFDAPASSPPRLRTQVIQKRVRSSRTLDPPSLLGCCLGNNHNNRPRSRVLRQQRHPRACRPCLGRPCLDRPCLAVTAASLLLALLYYYLLGRPDDLALLFLLESQKLTSPELLLQLHQSRQRTAEDAVSEPKIILFTYLFGEHAVHKRYIQTFLESSRRAGVDIAIVGDPAPAFPLPSNAIFVPISWDGLVDRVRDRIFLGKREPRWMRHELSFYKVNDYKPSFAYLFPEVVQGYDFWGAVDNDLILGDVRNIINRTLLAEYDILCPNEHEFTLGMNTFYRNTPIVNELFWLTKRPESVFNSILPRAFDEYGGPIHGLLLPYESTMAGIVEQNHERLGIRWYGGFEHVFDGPCVGLFEGMCCECHLTPLPNGRQRLMKMCLNDNFEKESLICHFQYTKRKVEESLQDDERFEKVLAQHGRYRINFLEGFEVD